MEKLFFYTRSLWLNITVHCLTLIWSNPCNKSCPVSFSICVQSFGSCDIISVGILKQWLMMHACRQTKHRLLYFLLWHVKVFWFCARSCAFSRFYPSTRWHHWYTPPVGCVFNESQACPVGAGVSSATLNVWHVYDVQTSNLRGNTVQTILSSLPFRVGVVRALPVKDLRKGSVDFFLVLFCLSQKNLQPKKSL